MIISREYKFIFLSNPRCASTTIRAVILPYSQVSATTLVEDAKGSEEKQALREHNSEILHIGAFSLKRSMDKAIELMDSPVTEEEVLSFEDYYNFSTIRNPYSRLTSWYFYQRPDKNFLAFHDSNYDPDSAFHHHFNDYVDHISEEVNAYKGLPNYEHFFTDHETGESLIDHEDIFKVEELNETFIPRFEEKTGIDLKITTLPKIMPDYEEEANSQYLNWQGDTYELYNENSKQYVEEYFATDLEKFSYEFGQ